MDLDRALHELARRQHSLVSREQAQVTRPSGAFVAQVDCERRGVGRTRSDHGLRRSPPHPAGVVRRTRVPAA